MNLLKYLFFAGLAFIAFTIYAKYSKQANAGAAVGPLVSAAGFTVMPPNDLPNDKAVIVALPDCSKEEAKRAHDLDFQLMQAGIPRVLRADVTFEFSSKVEEIRQNRYLNTVARPFVFVRGKLKGNPTVMEVVAEYRGVPLPPPKVNQGQKE